MKKTYWLAVGAIGTAVALWASTDSEEMPILAKAVPSAVASTEHRYAQIPLAFERNVGQTDPEVLFLARGPGYGIFLTATEAVLSLPSKPGSTKVSTQAGAPTVVRMSLLGASTEPVVEGAGLQQGKSHYYYGSTPNQWQRDVQRYDRVRYREVYPGIDMVYYGKQQQLEYDFVVAPGRNPGRINVKFSGVDGLRLDPDGNLILETASGTLTQQKPVLYQQVDGRRKPVQGGYRLLSGDRVGFEVAAYDTAKPLIIDPVLGYSSYFGGSGDDGIASLSADDAGNLYAIGTTASLNFPLKNAIQSSNRGGGDIFVTKFNTDGNALVYSTFMGGGNADGGTGIAVDIHGNAYITGHTKSTNFPVANALQRTHAADGGLEDAFVARLDSAGALAFSTYLGGSGADLGTAIDLPPSGDLYVAGSTESGNFPRVSAMDASLGGTRDGFLAKLTRSGDTLVFSTYFGGGGTDQISAMSVDPSPGGSGAIYLTGETASTDFPVSAGTAIQTSLGGGSDAFVVVLSPAAVAPYIAMELGTYLGSANTDAGEGIDLDPEGNVIVVGRTEATSAAPFPTANPAQDESAGGIDGFVAKITLGATPALAYSTYLGGSGEDRLTDVKVDDFGTAYVIGTTNSTDLIGTSSVFGLQHANGGGFDAMTARYSDEGERFWASYLGGSGNEQGAAIARYGSSSIFLGGSTASTNFSTLLPFKSANSGASDAFVTRYGIRSMRTNARNFNADRTDDILWRNSSTGANAVWRSAGGTTTTTLTNVPVGPWKLVGTGDFDGDARADILWRNSGTGANHIWRGASSSNVMILHAVTDQKWQIVGIGDFNLDSRSDILWRHGSTGANAVWLSGDYATQQSVRSVTDTAWKVAGLGDFDGDFVSDILWRHSGTGANAIWLSGDFTTPQAITHLTNLSWQVAGIGDFLGDGKSDILWFQPTTGQAVIWRNADYARKTSLPNVNLQFAISAIGDYNGDGRSDILMRNQTTGANVLWRSGSASNSQTLVSVANQSWKIVR
ncbi:SBBP repeat-containing protein [Lysobacter sp. M15]|uniref:DUF7948 domain-containing protein n=1 Tax=Lysobacter sp. M15 TaxID=2916837 RepID=UPI001F5681C3|nr:SBBP repeat-containing protein [Lysobacter sp. M15]